MLESRLRRDTSPCQRLCEARPQKIKRRGGASARVAERVRSGGRRASLLLVGRRLLLVGRQLLLVGRRLLVRQWLLLVGRRLLVRLLLVHYTTAHHVGWVASVVAWRPRRWQTWQATTHAAGVDTRPLAWWEHRGSVELTEGGLRRAKPTAATAWRYGSKVMLKEVVLRLERRSRLAITAPTLAHHPAALSSFAAEMLVTLAAAIKVALASFSLPPPRLGSEAEVRDVHTAVEARNAQLHVVQVELRRREHGAHKEFRLVRGLGGVHEAQRHHATVRQVDLPSVAEGRSDGGPRPSHVAGRGVRVTSGFGEGHRAAKARAGAVKGPLCPSRKTRHERRCQGPALFSVSEDGGRAEAVPVLRLLVEEGVHRAEVLEQARLVNERQEDHPEPRHGL